MESNYVFIDLEITHDNQDATVQAEKMLNDIYMDLFFKKIHRKQIRERILTLIDKSLDDNDKAAFLTYVAQLEKFEKLK